MSTELPSGHLSPFNPVHTLKSIYLEDLSRLIPSDLYWGDPGMKSRMACLLQGGEGEVSWISSVPSQNLGRFSLYNYVMSAFFQELFYLPFISV
jgi:hypothetical protein